MTKIDIYAMIPGAGEQTWTIWTSDVSKECAKIQACLKEHKLYQTDNVIMSVDPSFNNCSTLLINPKYITLVAVDDHVVPWTYSKAEIDAGADKNEKEND
ncbi:MAG: hypothetical protein ACIRZL_03790 [Limosilactobacillus mucosae]